MKPNLIKQFACNIAVYFILLFLISTSQLLAQAPINDACAGATLLVSSTNCTSISGTFIRAIKTGSASFSCGIANSPDVWYKFVAKTSHPSIRLSNIGSNLNSKNPFIQLWSGGCAGFSIVCGTSPLNLSTSYPTGLTIGATYYIRITTNTNFSSPTSGNYGFDICITDLKIDYGKSYTNISDSTVGGTINAGDTLEIRTTLTVGGGYWNDVRAIYNVAFADTLKAGKGFSLLSSNISTRTNEGKIYQFFTDAADADAGWWQLTGGAGSDTAIKINLGTGATYGVGGTITNMSVPNFFQNFIIMATYRVKVNAVTGTKINYGGGAFRYATTAGGALNTINFPSDSLLVFETLSTGSDAVSPTNLIGNANNGTFGAAASSADSLQNGGAAAVNTTYGYQTFNIAANTPADYYYGVANNTSPSNSIIQTSSKISGATNLNRVFDVWDITGDHTGAPNQSKGNKPCNPSKARDTDTTSPNYNPCGYMMAINAAYKTDVAFEYTATGACSETYYEVSAWFKNLCYKCSSDSLGRSSHLAGYIPTAVGDSSGVRPNIAMKIDGVDYYTTGELKYQGLGGTQTGSDTLNNWVRRSFVFKTAAGQTSFKITFRNNAPGGGGNDWAIDDIGLRTCYPTMIYAPSTTPQVQRGNTITISDTVRSFYNSYVYYQWQKSKAVAPNTWFNIGASGMAVPIYNGSTYQYVKTYTITSDSTQIGNNGDSYRMVVATNATNLLNGCNFTPDLKLTINTVASLPCAVGDTNRATTPDKGVINWNDLQWNLKHIPTCCESAFITYSDATNTADDSVIVNITNDICIRNLILFNAATSTFNKKFKTVLDTSYKMLMNGNVNMFANGALATDSCIFIANGKNKITVLGKTTIGGLSDRAFSMIGTSPNVNANVDYILRGDSLIFNSRGFTNDKLMTVNMDPINDTAYFVNNTSTAPYPYAVTFENFKIGDGVKASTVIAAGTNPNSFLNNKAGKLKITNYSKLVLPANYTINSRGVTSAFDLSYKAYLELGGSAGGIAGSNFPLNYISYYIDSTSTVLFYGGAQSLPGAAEKINNFGNLCISGWGIKKASSSLINILGDFCRLAGTHTFDANAGRVTFSSAVKVQKYYAAVGTTPINFYDFTNNNLCTDGLLIDSSIGILNELELMPSTKFTLNNGDVNMRSSAARTSHITDLGTINMPTVVYNGTNRFVIERYLYGKKAWRFLATPLQINALDPTAATIAASWRENKSAHTSTGYGVIVTGSTGPAIASAAGELDLYTQRGSMKYYNDAADVWVEIANTSSTKISNLKGYMVFVRGDRGALNTVAGAGTETNLRIKGKINTGNQTFVLAANKFQAVGNPFASQIKFNAANNTNAVAAFTVWKPTNVGLYNVGGYENYILNAGNFWLNGIVGGTKRNNIESGEAFFVQSNSATTAGSIVIKESDKTIDFNTVSRGGNASNADIVLPTLDIQLFSKLVADSFSLVDGASVNFDNNYSLEIDNDDVRKLVNRFDNLCIKSSNKTLVVERKPMPTETDSIQLNIAGTRVGEYRLDIDPSLLTNAGVDIFIKDRFLLTTTAINSNELLQVPFSITADAASKAIDRFVITFKLADSIKIAAERNADKIITVNWGVSNEKNVSYYTLEQSNDGINFNILPLTITPTSNTGGNPFYIKLDTDASKNNNWYRVKATLTNGTTKYSRIAMLAAVKNEVINVEEQLISVYPNPVEHKIINLYFKNQAKGNYTWCLINNFGQTINNGNINIINFLQKNNIIINNNSAAGYYTLVVKMQNEKEVKLSILLK